MIVGREGRGGGGALGEDAVPGILGYVPEKRVRQAIDASTPVRGCRDMIVSSHRRWLPPLLADLGPCSGCFRLRRGCRAVAQAWASA